MSFGSKEVGPSKLPLRKKMGRKKIRQIVIIFLGKQEEKSRKKQGKKL